MKLNVFTNAPHLFNKSVVWTIQIELSQVISVSKNQIGLLLCTQTSDKKHMHQDSTGYKLEAKIWKMHVCLTWCRFADGGVIGANFKAVHAETVEAAMCVDAALRTGIGGCALVYIHTRLPITLQLETRMAPALKGPRAQEMSKSNSPQVLTLLAWPCYKCLPLPVTKHMLVSLILMFPFNKSLFFSNMSTLA